MFGQQLKMGAYIQGGLCVASHLVESALTTAISVCCLVCNSYWLLRTLIKDRRHNCLSTLPAGADSCSCSAALHTESPEALLISHFGEAAARAGRDSAILPPVSPEVAWEDAMRPGSSANLAKLYGWLHHGLCVL